jgi:predicted branched-subunit amino acid permease
VEEGVASKEASFVAGLARGSPILMGLLPFGLIYGAAARDAGLSFSQTALMSVLVFAGSAQLVFVNLWNEGVNSLALALTVVLVNLRLLVYGSSIGPFLERNQGLFWRLARSYLLTDESYAASLSAFASPAFKYRPAFFYLGAGFPTWLGWQASGAAGYLSGSFLPESVPLEMAAPLVFLALLLSMLKSGRTALTPRLCSLFTAGISAVLLNSLPYNLGLLLSILLGVLAGVASSRAKRRRGV